MPTLFSLSVHTISFAQTASTDSCRIASCLIIDATPTTYQAVSLGLLSIFPSVSLPKPSPILLYSLTVNLRLTVRFRGQMISVIDSIFNLQLPSPWWAWRACDGQGISIFTSTFIFIVFAIFIFAFRTVVFAIFTFTIRTVIFAIFIFTCRIVACGDD